MYMKGCFTLIHTKKIAAQFYLPLVVMLGQNKHRGGNLYFKLTTRTFNVSGDIVGASA